MTSRLATVSSGSWIVSWLLLPRKGAFVAIVTGHMATSEIRKAMGQPIGNPRATPRWFSNTFSL
jgi:hypothetical protein